MNLAALLAALAQWNAVLPSLLAGEQNGLAAYNEIKAVLAARGFAADTAVLDGVILDATNRKAKEDTLLDPPVAPV